MNLRSSLLVWSLSALSTSYCPAADLAGHKSPLVIDTDFSGGSGQVIEINQEHRYVSIRPTPHPHRGWACWWYVRLSGVRPGETTVVEVGDAPWATPDRAVFSTDNRRWRQTEPGERRGKRIAYRQAVGCMWCR